MGNQAYLFLGQSDEFEANNVIPVTWLTLFSSEDLIIESQSEDGERHKIAKYRTTSSIALARLKQVIAFLKDKTFVWPFLRPIEILQEVITSCAIDGYVELDLTQFWEEDRTIVDSISKFANFLDSIKDMPSDVEQLQQLVAELSVNHISSIAQFDSETKMFIFIGTFYGSEELENLYSLEYFDDDYWNLP